MRFLAAFAALMLFAPAAPAQTVVAELFTTASCADTPPADWLMKKLADNDADLLVLGCHVTYIESGAWKNTLEAEFCDERHFKYFHTLQLDQIYTPTLIVNGRHTFYDAPDEEIQERILESRAQETIADIPLSVEDGQLRMTLPALTLEENKATELWLFAYDDLHTVDIEGGQNAGITVDYINAVRHLEKLPAPEGSGQSLTHPVGDIRADGYAVIAQYEGHGAILAAGRTKAPDPP